MNMPLVVDTRHALLTTFLHTFVGRRNAFTVQRPDGGYWSIKHPLTLHDTVNHLTGKQTLGSYVTSEQGLCSYAVFDADREDGLSELWKLHVKLASQGIPSYLEASRRGGHLWVFLTTPVRASMLRTWLLPTCPSGIEFFPKQEEGHGYGSLIRLPFGVHRKSGKRYPFVERSGSSFMPVASSLKASLAWLATLERVTVPPLDMLPNIPPRSPIADKKTSFSPNAHRATTSMYKSIREWCAHQDAVSLISRYVSLNAQGIGCCPFGWHHSGGRDTHASFKVYTPGVAGGYCWYCHVWQQGGSVFDFLRYTLNLDARSLWQRIQEGGQTW
jgi:hypothetical protein